VRLRRVDVHSNMITKLPLRAPLQVAEFDVRNNSIVTIMPLFCCGVSKMKTEGNVGTCNVSCSQHGNPWAASGCQKNEVAFPLSLPNGAHILEAKLCTATSCKCTGDLPLWNPSGVEHCVSTRIGADRCVLLCADNVHCGHPRSLCVTGLLDESVVDQSGRPLGTCVYIGDV